MGMTRCGRRCSTEERSRTEPTGMTSPAGVQTASCFTSRTEADMWISGRLVSTLSTADRWGRVRGDALQGLGETLRVVADFGVGGGRLATPPTGHPDREPTGGIWMLDHINR